MGRGMRQADLLYWEERAEAQLRLARLAADDRVARAHALLAGYYFDRVHNRLETDSGRDEDCCAIHPLHALVRLPGAVSSPQYRRGSLRRPTQVASD